MILTVDIGNSHIVLGGFREDDLCFQARLQTETRKTSDQFCVDLKILLDVNDISPDQIEGAIIASVVPQVLNNIRSAIYKLTGKHALVVGPGLKTGLNLLLENPGQTGADLVAADVAALRTHKPPLILIDMGTATTISVLDKNGAHIGGCICPGVQISLDALMERTALLPGIQLDKPKKAIGRNTVDAMRSGVLLGAAFMLDGMVARMEAELGQKATVIATGGIAQFIIPLCATPIVYDKDLVLKGLLFLYRENRRG